MAGNPLNVHEDINKCERIRWSRGGEASHCRSSIVKFESPGVEAEIIEVTISEPTRFTVRTRGESPLKKGDVIASSHTAGGAVTSFSHHAPHPT